MKSSVSLNMRGVRPEAMETAQEAARRSGLSLEQWINSAIIETAADAGIQPRRRNISPGGPFGRSGDDRLNTVTDRLDDLAARLDNLTRRSADPVAPKSRPSAGDAASQRLAEAIARLDARLDRLTVGRPIAGDFEPRIAAVENASAALNREPLAQLSESPAGLEQAVAEIAARQRALDLEDSPATSRGPAVQPAAATGFAGYPSVSAQPDLSGLERQLRAITEQIETLRRPCGVEDAIGALRHDLAEIARTLTEALPRRILESLQAEIRAVAERIEITRRPGPEAPAFSSVERGLVEVRDALNALAPAESLTGFNEEVKALSRKIDHLAATGPDAETLRQLDGAIAELRAVSAKVASGETLAVLAADVRAIGAKLDRVIASGSARDSGVETLAKRIEALAASLDAGAAASNPAVLPHVESLIKSLSDNLETAYPATSDRSYFDRLEQRIVQLAQRLDATDAHFGNLGSIERSIADMVAQLKDAHSAAIEAAEQAAAHAVREAIAQASASDAEIDVLKHELGEFRHAQAEIDRRTQDTLEAVHGTLERLVDRLAMIETDIHAQAVHHEMRAPRDTELDEAAEIPAGPPRALVPPGAGPGARGEAPAAATSHEWQPEEGSAIGDQPLEPGSGAPRGRAVPSPAERIAASEAVLGPRRPATPAEPGGRADFIAAARRAAQAAAAQGPAGSGRAGEEPGRSPLFAAIGRAIDKRRRPLLIGIGAILLAIGILNLMFGIFGSGKPATIDQRPAANRPALAPDAKPANPTPHDFGEPAGPAATPPGPRTDLAPRNDSIVSDAPAAGVLGGADGSPVVAAPMITPSAGPASAQVPGGLAGPATPLPPAVTLSSLLSGPEPAGVPGKLPETIGGPMLRAAAASGSPEAEFEVGVRYAEGHGVPQNLEEAARWMERAAGHGLVPAQYRLGSLYEKGQGVKKDLEAARRLYTAAAERGNGKAMHNLAVLYAEGLDGKPDYSTALQWFRKAADHGIADSQYNLGILFARGIGSEQNLPESYKWFALAAQQGDQDAVKKRDEVAGRLDPQSLVAARLAVQTWTADPQPDEAIKVKSPDGGWDRPITGTPPAKPKQAIRSKSGTS